MFFVVQISRLLQRRSLRVLAVSAACGFLCLPPSAGAVGLEHAAPVDTVDAAAGLDRITGPILETTVVGLRLQGERHRDRLRIPDLDILLSEDGRRLLPLLRTLRILQIQITESGTSLILRPERTPEGVVDY
ncbi:MAG: hypothetical protein KAW17_03855, partial [Candidatus Eisenbacteria sp.]|nr:hypothetical protein [Candidatus Eisenbacteria bacterium]